MYRQRTVKVEFCGWLVWASWYENVRVVNPDLTDNLDVHIVD